MNKDKNFKKVILAIQIVLTLFGTILAFVLLFRTFKAPTLLGVLGSITIIVAYIYRVERMKLN